LEEVSKIVKQKGAFLHNVMPLIAEAEHGTFYGVMGQRSPSSAELQELQDACAGDMNMMRHCRQCRADAVGLLGEDRGDEFTMDKIENMEIDYAAAMEVRKKVHDGIAAELKEKNAKKQQQTQQNIVQLEVVAKGKDYPPVLVAVATHGGGVINVHFGHAQEFLIYEASMNGVRFIHHRKVEQYCGGNDTCGDGESSLERNIRTLEGCVAVLCSKVGFEPWNMLEEAGIEPNHDYAMEAIEDSVMKYYQKLVESGKLDKNSEVKEAAALGG
jgi:nitrogen fixation protein NifB